MPKENEEFRRFLNRSKWFSRIFPGYREFVNLVDFIDSLLSPEQKQFLEIKHGEETIDFKTQLLIYFEDRYSSEDSDERKRESVEKFIDEHRFLFETNLEANKIRSILLRGIMDLITFGSQCFFVARSRVKWGKGGISFASEDGGTIETFKNKVLIKYPDLPNREDTIRRTQFKFSIYEELFVNRSKSNFNNEEENLWISEFLKRTDWFFDKLNSCEEEQRNKYKERIFQEVNLFIGEDKNSTHTLSRQLQRVYLFKLENTPIETNVNKHIFEITEEILNNLGSDVVNGLQETSSLKFKEQLLQRYYSRYSSFVSLEEIKEYIKKKCYAYKHLLAGENKLLIREIFMDDLDQELFISKNTQVWNEEMFKNLSEPIETKISANVEWAIEQIVNSVNSEKLNLKIEGKEYSLRTLLIARWSRSLLAQGKKAFMQKLLELRIQTPYHFSDLKEEISAINLQIFLEKIDTCFLYPRKGRKIKVLLNKDDTGSLLKLKKNIASLINEIDKQLLSIMEIVCCLIAGVILGTLLWLLLTFIKSLL